MNILETLVQLRDDLKTWVTNNLNELNKKIDEKAIPIDGELSTTSTNPVQNKVINAEISSLSNLVGDKSVATQISTAIANQDLFSGDYNDLQNAPNISDDGSNDLKVSDKDGNIIAQIDVNGLKTTKVTANNVNINGTDIQENTPGKVELADENGNVIVRVDNNGIHTTEIEADGIKIKEILSDHINNDGIHVTLDDKNTWNAKSDFSGDYNDLINAPNIAEDGTSDMTIADEAGNIIFKINAAGAHTTTLDAQNITINNENIDNIMDKKITALVNSAPETLDTLGELAEAMETHSNTIETLEVIATSKAAQSDLDTTNANVIELQGLVGNATVSKQIADAIASQEHFSGDYNDLKNTPNIIENKSSNLDIVDPLGNVITTIDGNGIVTTDIFANDITSNGNKVLTTKDLVRVIYTGTIVPANLAGKDGDIYIQI